MDCSMPVDEYDNVIAMACGKLEAQHNSTPAATPPTQIPKSTTRTEQSLGRGISTKYINSKVRKLDLKAGKPLPLHVMQLRREKPFQSLQFDKKFKAILIIAVGCMKLISEISQIQLGLYFSCL